MAKLELKNLKNGSKIVYTSYLGNIEVNDDALKKMIRLQLDSLRQGTHKTKTRSEVSGGGRKPWKQKGTGRARQGSIRATQWRGGGIAGGVTPRDYGFKINRKERVLAIKSALADKLASKSVVVFENLDLKSKKTKDLKDLITNCKLEGKILFVTKDDCENLFLAGRNLGYVYHLMADEINVYDIVNADTLVLDEAAVKAIEEVMLHA